MSADNPHGTKMTPEEVLKRIAFIQAELAALLSWVTGNLTASPGTPAPVEVYTPPARPSKKLRWRYVPGSWYRIVGDNPFRDGNNFNLFEFLARRYGDRPFSREDLSEAIRALREAGRISSVQNEDQIVLVFLRTGGAEKNRIAMASPPNDSDAGPIADVQDSLPPEPGDIVYRLLGEIPFRSGVNVHIWTRMGNKPFVRDQILEVVRDLVEGGAFDSIRPPETIVRDFLGRVQEKGRLERS